MARRRKGKIHYADGVRWMIPEEHKFEESPSANYIVYSGGVPCGTRCVSIDDAIVTGSRWWTKRPKMVTCEKCRSILQTINS
jgi:hypothetical protein